MQLSLTEAVLAGALLLLVGRRYWVLAMCS
jgi:hypothetical protein